MLIRGPLAAHLLLLLWAALVASSFPAASGFNPDLSTNLLVSVRFLLAGGVLLLLLPDRTWPGGRAVVVYALLGLLLAGFFSIMFKALQYSTPLTLAALFVTQPLFAYLLAIAAGMEAFRLSRLVTLLLAALAALVIVSRAELHTLAGLHPGLGELIFLCACVLSAGYSLLSRYASDRGLIRADALRTTCFSLLGGGLLIGLPETLAGDLPEFLRSLGSSDLLALGYLTLFTTLLSFWMLQVATLRLAPSMVAAYGYLSPMLLLSAELVLGITHWRMGYLPAMLLLAVSIRRLARDGSVVA